LLKSVIQAWPAMLGTTAGTPPTVVKLSMTPSKWVSKIDRG